MWSLLTTDSKREYIILVFEPYCTVTRPPLKKGLFPVKWVAIIVASREAAKSFFPLCIEMVGKMLVGKKGKLGNVKKKVPTRY